jgi:hypothetical protein
LYSRRRVGGFDPDSVPSAGVLPDRCIRLPFPCDPPGQCRRPGRARRPVTSHKRTSERQAGRWVVGRKIDR